MSKIFAVIDTNVVVSGMITKNPESPTVGVLASLSDKNITPLYCEEILEEYKSVLNREKFQLPKEKIETFEIEISEKDAIHERSSNSQKKK